MRMWESRIHRIQGSLALSGIKVSQADLERELRQGEKTMSVIGGYNSAIMAIQDMWVGADTPVTYDTVEDLAKRIYVGPFISYRRPFLSEQKLIRQLIQYLENDEHPAIRAAVALGILSSDPIADQPGLVSRMLACMYLARDGYMLRNLASPEYQWALDAHAYQYALSTIAHEQSLSTWLLYVTQSIETHFTKLHRELAQPTRRIASVLTLLNDRQRAILHLTDNPEMTLTNKMVQKHFRISQITASRDLAKLVALHLILPRGGGRSVSYTRA